MASDLDEGVCICPDGTAAVGNDKGGLEFSCRDDRRPLLFRYPSAAASIFDDPPKRRFASSLSRTISAEFAHAPSKTFAVLVGIVCTIVIFVILYTDSQKAPLSKPMGAADGDGFRTLSPSDDKIFLKLRRSQRASFFGRPIFVLDARADVSPEVMQLIRRYNLGGLVVYDSKARRTNAQAAYANFSQAGAEHTLTRSLLANARGIANSAKMIFTLRITVAGLLKGRHIECRDLGELLSAEVAIVDACKNMRNYIDTALSFDGSEDVHEF